MYGMMLPLFYTILNTWQQFYNSFGQNTIVIRKYFLFRKILNFKQRVRQLEYKTLCG